ncbi:MAG: hypothetical protein ABI882_14400, partial [Acidobacteriota bacterium]
IDGLASESIFRALMRAHEAREPIGYAEIAEELSEEARQDLASLVDLELADITSAWNLSNGTNFLDAFRWNCLSRLRTLRLQRELQDIQHQIRQTEASPDSEKERLPALQLRKMELGRELALLQAQPR